MDKTTETRLRGEALEGSEQKQSVDHVAVAKKRDVDNDVRVDNEKDSLYDDGLEVEDDSETLAGTSRNVNPG